MVCGWVRVLLFGIGKKEQVFFFFRIPFLSRPADHVVSCVVLRVAHAARTLLPLPLPYCHIIVTRVVVFTA